MIAVFEGTFLGAGVREREYDGKKETSVQIDVYQSDSPLSSKTIAVKSEDMTVLNRLAEFKMGSAIKLKCQINAYKNVAYLKLLDLIK